MQKREQRKQQKKRLDAAVGMRVRLIREAAEQTQEEFAEMIDVRPQFISDIERGVVGLSTVLLSSISERYCVSCDYILMGRAENSDIADIIDKLKCMDEKQLEIFKGILNQFIRAMSLAQKQVRQERQ